MNKLYFRNIDDDEPIWVKYNLEPELIAGIIAGGIGCLTSIKNNKYYFDTDANISNYRILKNIPEDSIRVNTSGWIEDNEYGIWLLDDIMYNYSLYRFRTSKFIQGILSICQSFNVDFRNIVYGFTFDKNLNSYVLQGYQMLPYNYTFDIPDLNDVEEENADNENIIVPYHIDNDILSE